ncbi:D-alanyl-D-alanine endopeptidase (penicillin-binding protein 7) [Janthinobacterium sp. 67]|uniref:M56 family metallopeptidase n=1 Tax=Janthinobacterium sp. 67 TaxID=2035207 RepID=UPI000C24C2B9|nr:M56 family metallopeptidase [Janthinobacterium sp. 67]PJJ17224.1 D-alanyl-D-alanine endopeptidase (penicillin-binding protein 7) [Janthinobacterium sp. 67]
MNLDISLGKELGNLVPALGWVLLYFVWQGVIVGAVSAVLLWLLRHASARWRYAVCALALLLCLCIPSAHLLSLLSGISPAQLPLAAPPAWRAALQAWMPALVLAWGAGVGLMSLRLCLGLAWVGKLRRQAVAAPAIWQARLDALARRMGLRGSQQVPLKLHAGLASPVTVGFWRPVILLPAALLSGMPVALLEALLAHELAHVRRWDYLVNLLQSVAEALLFFHPVVWWLSARMRTEREQVADALAAQALQDPQQLATALHALSLQTAAPNHSGLLMSARGGALLARIERLMAPGPDTGGWKMAVPALLLACATLLLQMQGKPEVNGATLAEAAAGMLDLPVSAKHMLVFDDASGKVLMAKDADAVVPIASITKLMTAMVVLDAGQDHDEQVRIVRADGEASLQRHSLLADGVAVSRGALLQLALLPSENRAAAALARTYPGGRGAFNNALQAKIRSLGLRRTSLTDPVGSSPANTSTASEVAKIVAAAARYPDIARITSHPQASVAVNGKWRTLHNTNPLVGSKGWDIVLSKTGSSHEAGSCLTMRMRSGGKHVTVVLLDADGAQRRSLDAGHIRDTLADRTGRMY